MNPQYLPPHQIGIHPPVSNAALAPDFGQTFQNVPLGHPRPGNDLNDLGLPSQSSSTLSTGGPSNISRMMGPPPANQNGIDQPQQFVHSQAFSTSNALNMRPSLPPNQLPPSHIPTGPQPSGYTSTNSGNIPSLTVIQNKSGSSPLTPFQNQFKPNLPAGAPLQGQNMPLRPSSNQTPNQFGPPVSSSSIAPIGSSLSHPLNSSPGGPPIPADSGPSLLDKPPEMLSGNVSTALAGTQPLTSNTLILEEHSLVGSSQIPKPGYSSSMASQGHGTNQYNPSSGASHLPRMPSIPGQTPLMPGAVPPLSGLPAMTGQVVHGSGQIPPLQGHLAAMPGQVHPMPGQMPPMSGLIPPLPGQLYQMNGSNQLANQMQGLNVNGSRQGPHMPPPLGPKNFTNGQQQMRSPQASGYPQMPQLGGGHAQSSYQQQPQQQKRLDPDQMPSPIQVTQDDQRSRSGVFVTNQKGLVPPLVSTNFIVQDQGNASPRFMRSTMYNVPISQDIMKQTAVPFSLVISPMAKMCDEEYPPPIVNFGDLGPVRCIRCKAYMCPYMQFIDSGRRFQCLFCKATTDVPAEYFQHLDHTGQRMDKYERPELVLGTYEFVATADYCRNNTLPKPPAIIFIIDVSYNNVKSGLVQLLCSQMKDIIQNLPVDQGQEKSNMRVGFITFNSAVHFYNIKGTLAAPQMLIVGDTQEMFMPTLDGFLCTPEESGLVIDALMEQIPIMFNDTKETEIVLLPAILAGLEALKASESSGKLIVFHSTLPTAEAPGKLKNRDDRKLLATDKERTVLSPQTQAYNQLGQDCVAAGCSVDIFVFNNSYIDIATISQVSRLTGGEVFKYTYFQADVDGERMIRDVIMDISRPVAFDGIMRVRTSTGVRPTDFYGHFFMSNTTDMELASVDCDKAVAVEIKHDDKLSEEEGVYIQTALLYTSCSGQRRLRIINLSLKTCSQMADLYRSCDLDTIINYIAKQSTYKLLDHSPKVIKDAIVTRAAQILATYRKNCATPSSAGQLILPECMKLLPLYVNCLLKSDALSGGSDMTIDDRAFVMQAVMMMDIPTSVNYFYPRLIPIHDIDSSKDTEIPAPVRCTMEKMNEQGVYILENGIHMFLWIGLGVNPEFVQNVFGTPSSIQIDIDKPLPELNNPVSITVRNIIDEIRIQRHRCIRLSLVRQREKLEPIFKHFLVEDRGTDGSASYVDFLCHMHKEIRGLLS